ncbi:MAG: hypothetical protein AAGK97_07235, partial [Bacteroidota bacterium]
MKILKTMLILCLVSVVGFAQNEIGKEIQTLKQNQINFSNVNLLTENADNDVATLISSKVLTDATIIKLNTSAIQQLQDQVAPYIKLAIPQEGQEDLVVELMLKDIFGSDFNLYRDR